LPLYWQLGVRSWFLTFLGLAHGRGVSGSNLLGDTAGGRDLAPETGGLRILVVPPSGGAGSSPPSADDLVHRRGPFSSRSAPTRKIGESEG
jgi:hypothetical protein